MVIPAGTTGWGSGWIVFVDVNRNDVFDTSSDILVMNRDAPAAYLTVAGTDGTAALSSPAVPYVMFDASGYAKPRLSSRAGWSSKRNDVAADQELAHTRRLLIDRSGRARVCKPATSSDAQCPAKKLNGLSGLQFFWQSRCNVLLNPSQLIDLASLAMLNLRTTSLTRTSGAEAPAVDTNALRTGKPGRLDLRCIIDEVGLAADQFCNFAQTIRVRA